MGLKQSAATSFTRRPLSSNFSFHAMGLCEACVRCTQNFLRWLIHEASTGSEWISAGHLSFPEILSSAPSCDLCYLLTESCMRRFRAYSEELLSEEVLLDYVKARMSDEPLPLDLSKYFETKQVDQLCILSSSAGLWWNLAIWAEAGKRQWVKGRTSLTKSRIIIGQERSYKLHSANPSR